jgi:hypothetical protein
MMKRKLCSWKNCLNQKEHPMSDQIPAREMQKVLEENSTVVRGKAEGGSPRCPMQVKGWLKGTLGMAICCAAPLLLLAAIAFFGLSLGAIASGALSLVALLACPIGMLLMMRMMMKDKNWQDAVI